MQATGSQLSHEQHCDPGAGRVHDLQRGVRATAAGTASSFAGSSSGATEWARPCHQLGSCSWCSSSGSSRPAEYHGQAYRQHASSCRQVPAQLIMHLMPCSRFSNHAAVVQSCTHPHTICTSWLRRGPEHPDAHVHAACRAQRQADKQQRALVLSQGQRAILPTATGGHKEYLPSAAIAKRLPSRWVGCPSGFGPVHCTLPALMQLPGCPGSYGHRSYESRC